MTIAEVASACDAEIILDGTADCQISAAYTSDMLSDVMAHAPEDSVLITIQSHVNTIAVCTLAGIKAVMVCHGRDITDDMITAAKRENVGLLKTNLDQFTASCRLVALSSAGT